MYFNSFTYTIFFPLVWTIYWLLPFRFQNRFLLVASYVFYGFWDWRFLSLIAISTVVDYCAGLQIHQEVQRQPDTPTKRRKYWLTLSVCTNLGFLGFFKYFNFFIDSFEDLVALFGLNPDLLHLNIVLPVGISFYTFQTMSYTIDIYRGQMQPTRRFFDFALYVAFFPQLVAGPIERARNLLPRILKRRQFSFDQMFEGLHLILVGLFKKVFVADNLAPFVDQVFAQAAPTGWEVLLGMWGFAIQIYGDFSGYSDIARGSAKCLGIDLMVNFNHPYVAVNPQDRWSRWHISLSSWLRDYLYIPLGGNRRGSWNTYRNLGVTMLLGGLWHGAAWNFVLWGAWEGMLLIVHRLFKPVLASITVFRRWLPALLRTGFKILVMFHLVCLGWIIFRSQSAAQIYTMFGTLFGFQGQYGPFSAVLFKPLVQFGLPLFLYEALQYAVSHDDWQIIDTVPIYMRSIVYSVLFYMIAFYGAAAQSFIYFQF